jgi:hypothetical protein
MVKKKWGEITRKKKQYHCFGRKCTEFCRVLFISLHILWLYIFIHIPLFSSLEHFVSLCEHHLTHRSHHMSARVWGYDHFTFFFSKTIFIINLRHQRFINHAPTMGDLSRGRWYGSIIFLKLLKGNCLSLSVTMFHRDLSEQMSRKFKSDVTSLLTDNTFKYSSKHRWLSRFNIKSNLAEISCRGETKDWITRYVPLWLLHWNSSSVGAWNDLSSCLNLKGRP